MKLNNTDFPIYITDTVQTIEIRIAAFLKTTPTWLVFDKKRYSIEEYKHDNVVVTDVLKSVYKSNSLTFPNIPLSIDRGEAEAIFVASNLILGNATNDEIPVLFPVLQASLIIVHKFF